MSGVNSLSGGGGTALVGAVGIVANGGAITVGTNTTGGANNITLAYNPNGLTGLSFDNVPATGNVSSTSSVGMSYATDAFGVVNLNTFSPATGVATAGTVVAQNLSGALAWAGSTATPPVSTVAYAPGALVIYSNTTFVCRVAQPVGSALPADGANWQSIGGGGGSIPTQIANPPNSIVCELNRIDIFSETTIIKPLTGGAGDGFTNLAINGGNNYSSGYYIHTNATANWDGGRNYNAGALILYEDITYVAIVNVRDGEEPPDVNTDVWLPITTPIPGTVIAKNLDGFLQWEGSTATPPISTVAYDPGNMVIYEDGVWVCRLAQPVGSAVPGVDANWVFIARNSQNSITQSNSTISIDATGNVDIDTRSATSANITIETSTDVNVGVGIITNATSATFDNYLNGNTAGGIVFQSAKMKIDASDEIDIITTGVISIEAGNTTVASFGSASAGGFSVNGTDIKFKSNPIMYFTGAFSTTVEYYAGAVVRSVGQSFVALRTVPASIIIPIEGADWALI